MVLYTFAEHGVFCRFICYVHIRKMTTYFMTLTAGNLADHDIWSLWILREDPTVTCTCCLTKRKLMQKHSGQGSKLHTYKSQATTFKEMEIVEWLRLYELAINDVLLLK